MEYLCKWRKLGYDECSWETEEDLHKAVGDSGRRALEEFRARIRDRERGVSSLRPPQLCPELSPPALPVAVPVAVASVGDAAKTSGKVKAEAEAAVGTPKPKPKPKEGEWCSVMLPPVSLHLGLDGVGAASATKAKSEGGDGGREKAKAKAKGHAKEEEEAEADPELEEAEAEAEAADGGDAEDDVGEEGDAESGEEAVVLEAQALSSAFSGDGSVTVSTKAALSHRQRRHDGDGSGEPLLRLGRYPGSNVPPASADQVFKSGVRLRRYQVEGVNWLALNWVVNNRNCILADEMGLGKTLQCSK